MGFVEKVRIIGKFKGMGGNFCKLNRLSGPRAWLNWRIRKKKQPRICSVPSDGT
jgi:hypothetical protein